jgi:hypothetical protein
VVEFRFARAMMCRVSFVYHLCAEDFRGDELLPVKMLATRHPDVYEREIGKWAGRESVLDYMVPHLGVSWGDTVNLAGLDPALLVRARSALGVPFSRLLERTLLRIPVERLAGLPAVVYDGRTHWRNSRPGEDVPEVPPDDEFSVFDPQTYEEVTDVPQAHLDYLGQQRASGALALGFVFIRHVLVAGPVDVSGLERTPLGGAGGDLLSP